MMWLKTLRRIRKENNINVDIKEISCKDPKSQPFGNWICFHPQIKRERATYSVGSVEMGSSATMHIQSFIDWLRHSNVDAGEGDSQIYKQTGDCISLLFSFFKIREVS
jgi:hypothetical protein